MWLSLPGNLDTQLEHLRGSGLVLEHVTVHASSNRV